MKTSIILVTLLFITACESERRYWQVTCDSGFKTPISYHTYVQEGMIVWKKHKGGSVSKRKMLPGEICTDKSIIIKG